MKNKIGKIIGIIFLALLVIGVVFDEDETSNTPSTEIVNDKQWDDMSWEEKENWINNFINDPSDQGDYLMGQVRLKVKQKFNYPNEVEYNVGGPLYSSAYVTDAGTGLVHLTGTGKAKNSFGMSKSFRYNVNLIIQPDTLRIKSIEVK